MFCPSHRLQYKILTVPTIKIPRSDDQEPGVPSEVKSTVDSRQAIFDLWFNLLEQTLANLVRMNFMGMVWARRGGFTRRVCQKLENFLV